MLNVVSGLAFLGFAIACLRVAVAGSGDSARRKRAVDHLIACTLAVSFAAGLAQRDLWPFSNWRFATGLVAPEVTRVRVVAVDAAGGEHRVDPRAWAPLAYDELTPWLETVFPRLRPSDQAAVGAFLLARSESARRKVREGGPGALDGLLGPLTAPRFVLHPRTWWSAESAPPDPLVKVRLYRETWTLGATPLAAPPVGRRLAFEYPSP